MKVVVEQSQPARRSTIIWNYIGTLFNMGIQFMLLPFLLYFLSKEELGVWYVMFSFSNFANLFSFGFTPTFARNVAYCWNGAKQLKKTGKEKNAVSSEEPDYYLLKKILCTSQFLYLLFAVAGTFIIGLWGSLHIWNIAKDVLTFDIQVGWGVFLLAIFLNIYYGYYTSYLVGIGQVKENNQIMVIAAILRILVTAVSMGLGLGILGAALGYLANGITQRFLSRRKFYQVNHLKRKLSELKDAKLSFIEIKECFFLVWYNAWRDGLVSVSDYLSTQVSTIVCSSYLSLADTAMFSLTVQLVVAVGRIARSVHTAHTPVFQRAYIIGDEDTLRETQSFCIFIYVIVFCLGILGVLVVGLSLVSFMRPDVTINKAVLLGYAVFQFMLSLRNCYASYMSNTNRVWYWKSYIITSLVVVLVYTFFMKFISANIWWIIFISILGEIAYNFWKWPTLVNSELRIGVNDIVHLGYQQTRKLFVNGNVKKVRKTK